MSMFSWINLGFVLVGASLVIFSIARGFTPKPSPRIVWAMLGCVVGLLTVVFGGYHGAEHIARWFLGDGESREIAGDDDSGEDEDDDANASDSEDEDADSTTAEEVKQTLKRLRVGIDVSISADGEPSSESTPQIPDQDAPVDDDADPSHSPEPAPEPTPAPSVGADVPVRPTEITVPMPKGPPTEICQRPVREDEDGCVAFACSDGYERRYKQEATGYWGTLCTPMPTK